MQEVVTAAAAVVKTMSTRASASETAAVLPAEFSEFQLAPEVVQPCYDELHRHKNAELVAEAHRTVAAQAQQDNAVCCSSDSSGSNS